MNTKHDPERQHAFFPGHTDVRTSITGLLRHRWSPRAFSDRPVEPTKLLSLFEAARWSPSSANEQPWRFIAATKQDTRVYETLLSLLNEGNRRWAQRAPLLILGVAHSLYSANGKPYQHSWYDLGQSVADLTVEAEALGLAVHQMGGFDAAKAVELLSIPQGYEPVIAIAVGYADRPDILPDDLRQREETPRSRKPLESFVFTDEWGKPSRHIDPQSLLLNNPASTN
jgi:nitroreductase